MSSILRQRRDTAANWTTNNPVVPDGQLCFDITNNTFRIGNGITNYESLTVQSGEQGTSIDSVTGPTTVGNVDTYTINYSDATTSTFDVTNGTNGIDGVDGVSSGNFTGSITEQVAVCNLALEPDNGTVQTYTATGDFTLTDGLAEGQFLTLLLTNGGFTITYPTMTWFGDAEPTLGTTDKLFFEKIGGTLYGSHSGSIA